MMEDVKAGRISGLTNPQGFIHKLAPCRVTLRGRKSRTGHAENSKTLGEHLYRARLDCGLAQRQVAEAIGCHPRLAPELGAWPERAGAALPAGDPLRKRQPGCAPKPFPPII